MIARVLGDWQAMVVDGSKETPRKGSTPVDLCSVDADLPALHWWYQSRSGSIYMAREVGGISLSPLEDKYFGATPPVGSDGLTMTSSIFWQFIEPCAPAHHSRFSSCTQTGRRDQGWKSITLQQRRFIIRHVVVTL